MEIVSFARGADNAASLQFLADLIAQEVQDKPGSPVLSFYLSPLSYAAALASRLAGSRFFAAVRGNDIDLDVFGADAFQLQRALQSAEKVYCVTSELERKVRAFCPGTLTCCLPSGVDETLFGWDSAYLPDERPVLGLFGEIRAKKNLDFLLQGLDFERFRLKIVGSLREESAKLFPGFAALYPERARSIELVPFVKDPAELVQHKASI